MPPGSSSHRRRFVGRLGAAGIATVAMLAAAQPAWCQAPAVFRPNAGTILNVFSPPTERPSLPSLALPEPADDMPAATDSGARVRIYSVELEGVTLLPAADVEAQLAGLIGQEASLDDLRMAAARVTALYRERGFFLARAYVPAQQINGGGVRIAVLEGRYDRVEAGGSARFDGAAVEKTLAAQGVAAGQPIERHALERSLILLERKTRVPATALLQPGASRGSSSLQVDAPSRALFGGSLGADNIGSEYTGQVRSTASLQVNSPLGIGDLGDFWFAYSSGASAVFASYQVPVGHDGLTLGASHSYYRYELCCEFAALDRDGDATVTGIQLRYPLLLGQRVLLQVGLGFDRKRLTDTWASGDLADRQIRVAVFSLDGIAAVLHGQVRYRAALASGDLEIVGPPDLVELDAATVATAGQYSKLSGEVEILHPLTDRSFLNLRLSGQVASRNLDSSEKFLLGGYNGVRAYPEGEAAGDRAWLARIDWVLPLRFAAVPGSAAVRTFVDSGALWLVESTRGGLADPGISNHYSLSGAGLGFDWNLPRGIALSAYVATRIGDNPARAASGGDVGNDDGRTRGWVGAQWVF